MRGRVKKARHVSFVLAAAFGLMFGAARARAQSSARHESERARAAKELERTRAALVEASEEYKASTRALIALKEQQAARAAAKHEQLRQLVSEGLVSRRDLEESEAALKELRAATEVLRNQIGDADRLIAEVAAAAEAEEIAAAEAPYNSSVRRTAKTRGPVYSATAVIIRHTGPARWTIADLSGVQSFFITTFGRPLPTSAVGQTATHDRMGFDHSRAVDVALHPDSPEGRALINYLHANGITFIAFRAAVPGSATGPHIHIGPPSNKI